MEKKTQGLHIGLIMDGNGRWATQQDKPRLYGHARGVEVVREIVTAAPDMHIESITLFAFAIANWKRDKQEVDGLWKLFASFMETTAQEMLDEGVRIVCIGDKKGLPENIQRLVEQLEEDSKNNNTILLQIALNYDGVDEVTRLVRHTITEGVKAEEVTVKYIQSHLDTQVGTEPDIVIRTGMNKPKGGMSLWRSSGFLPIQSAQAVCVSTEVLWPDFTPDHLQKIITYAKPEDRLFGTQRGK